MPETTIVKQIATIFHNRFNKKPQIALAPGRVNLIGEHTDYNDGFVFPMAIDRHVGIGFQPRDDHKLRVYAPGFDEWQQADLDDLTPKANNGWIDYIAGTAWALLEKGICFPGADMVVLGDVPIGAGLSSSAALEIAAARALVALTDAPWDPVVMARLGQRAENEFVGVSCGIMDQFAAAASQKGHALLLDCRSLTTQTVALPSKGKVVVMDTGVRRKLTDSAYNERFNQCQKAVKHLQTADPSVHALRDVSPEMLYTHKDQIAPTIFRRAQHVVEENARTLQMAKALAEKKLQQAGRLMNASHKSLRDLYEVSSPALDAIVEAAWQHPACYGARLTGAGMGGCAVALVKDKEHRAFIQAVETAYQKQFSHPSQFYPTEPSEGARLVRC